MNLQEHLEACGFGRESQSAAHELAISARVHEGAVERALEGGKITRHDYNRIVLYLSKKMNLKSDPDYKIDGLEHH